MQAGSAMGDLASVIDLPSEEAALVAELQAGSEPAFAQLIAQYHQPLYSLIARSLQDPADASDITQEVFIKVFRNIAASTASPACARGCTGLRCTRPPTSGAGGRGTSGRRLPWRRRVVRAARCELRMAKRSRWALRWPMAAARPSTRLRRRNSASGWKRALRQVPEAFRTVVVLREIEGFTYEEIAEMLQVNLGTVKSRLMRGRAALRELLAPGDRVSLVRASIIGLPHLPGKVQRRDSGLRNAEPACWMHAWRRRDESEVMHGNPGRVSPPILTARSAARRCWRSSRHIDGFDDGAGGRVAGCKDCARELAAWRLTQDAVSRWDRQRPRQISR